MRLPILSYVVCLGTFLNGLPAFCQTPAPPVGGAAVAISSANPAAFPAPASTSVTAGKTSGSAPATAGTAARQTLLSLTANYSGSHSGTVAATSPSYTLGLPAITTSVAPGNSTVFMMYISPVPSSMPSFTCAACPAGIATNFFQTNNARYDIYGMNVAVGSGVAVGPYTLTVTSSDGSVAPFPVTVTVTNAGLVPHTALEINMGPMVFGGKDGSYDYTYGVSQYPVLANNCSATTMRACIQEILAKYRAQGITGVRFMFAMHDALDISATFTAAVRPAWQAEIQNFFQDLNDNAIYDITPTPDWESALPATNPIGGDGYQMVDLSQSNPQGNCAGYPVALPFRFSPTSPYGNRCYTGESCDTNHYGDVGDIDRGSDIVNGGVPIMNWSYACSPTNPSFVGWQNLYGAIYSLLESASNVGLTVREFDVQNEIDLEQFPVRGRLIVDSTHADSEGGLGGEDVLKHIRDRMALAFPLDSGAPGRVTYSATSDLSTVAGFDCGSLYGDSGRMHDASQLLGAFGGLFGYYDTPGAYGLPCMLSEDEVNNDSPEQQQTDIAYNTSLVLNDPTYSDQLVALPIGHSTPDILDVHTSPCLLVNNDCDPNPTNVAGESTIQFGDMQSLLASFGVGGWRCCGDTEFANALAMIGETHGHTQDGCLMNDGVSYWPTAAVPDMVSGFNQSTLSGRAFFGAPGVVFRPWEYLLNQPSGGADPVKCNPIVVNTVDSHLTPAQ